MNPCYMFAYLTLKDNIPSQCGMSFCSNKTFICSEFSQSSEQWNRATLVSEWNLLNNPDVSFEAIQWCLFWSFYVMPLHVAFRDLNFLFFYLEIMYAPHRPQRRKLTFQNIHTKNGW